LKTNHPDPSNTIKTLFIWQDKLYHMALPWSSRPGKIFSLQENRLAYREISSTIDHRGLVAQTLAPLLKEPAEPEE